MSITGSHGRGCSTRLGSAYIFPVKVQRRVIGCAYHQLQVPENKRFQHRDPPPSSLRSYNLARQVTQAILVTALPSVSQSKSKHNHEHRAGFSEGPPCSSRVTQELTKAPLGHPGPAQSEPLQVGPRLSFTSPRGR